MLASRELCPRIRFATAAFPAVAFGTREGEIRSATRASATSAWTVAPEIQPRTGIFAAPWYTGHAWLLRGIGARPPCALASSASACSRTLTDGRSRAPVNASDSQHDLENHATLAISQLNFPAEPT
eukprot:5328566-Pyramimonas_sp.AAC.2